MAGQLYMFLVILLDHRGELLSRDQIQHSLWAGRPVTDEAIRVAIKKLRDILGDDARAPCFIKTIPKQGYKWLAPVTAHSRSAATAHSSSTYQWAGLKGAQGWLLLLAVSVFGVAAALMFAANRPATGLISTVDQRVQLTPLTRLEESEVFAATSVRSEAGSP